MTSKTFFYILKRLLLALFTIFLVITITFFSMNAIPGGPFQSEKAVSAETLARLNAKYGLDKPLFEQYINYLGNILKLDFGPSLKHNGLTVSEILLDGLGNSATIGLYAAILAIILGVLAGTTAAVFRDKWIDRVIMIFTTGSVAMPSFVIGTLLLIIFCIYIPIFPTNGTESGGLILPVISLSLYPTSYITRLTRSSMLDVLGQDFIRTARAKGVSKNKVIFKHTLRNSLIPVITYVGPMIAYIVTGSLVVERIFSVPGLGKQFTSSIINRDYMLIMGTTILLATLVIIMNLISDILYTIVDPRIDLT